MNNENTRNMEVDFQHTTFQDKIRDYLDRLSQDLVNINKEMNFHKEILSLYEETGRTNELLPDLQDAIEVAEKTITALQERELQGKKLLEFLEGKFVLSFDKFVWLMIDVIGSQVVNYVELKNEFEEVTKLWTTPSN